MSDPMPDKVRKLFTIFKQAVEAERQAQAMYEEALMLCEDPATREAMQVLHDDEVRHEKEIIDRYNELRRRFNIDAPDA